MSLPDFIIAGTCKSGSTSLHQNLRKHPDVFTPRNEVHYFYSRDIGRYEEGREWYTGQFEETGEYQVIGEKTPRYAVVPECARRIRKLIPEVKLIWIFRDPVRRAYSDYWFTVNRGKEPLGFEAALQQEFSGERATDLERAYMRTGLYADQVERYLDEFDQEAMFFCTLRELKSAPAELFRRLYSFLEVDPDFADEFEFERRKKTAYTPYSPRLRHIVLDRYGANSWARTIEYKLNTRSGSGYPELSQATERFLAGYYAPSNRRLREITGLSLEHWASSVGLQAPN